MCEWCFVPDPVLATVAALCRTTDLESPTRCVHRSVTMARGVVDRGQEYHHHLSAFGQI